MYKYLFLLLFSTGVLADTGGVFTTDIKSFSDYPTDAKCAGHASDSEVQLIDEAADWSTINDANVYYYCVEPGDYDVDVSVTKVCTSGQRCYIWHYDTTETHEVHPVNMAEADRSIITQISFITGPAAYWVVDRITVRDPTDDVIRMQPAAGDNIILSRLLVEDSGGGAGQVAGGGDNNIVQNSVIRNSKITVSGDDHCLVHYGLDMKVVGNEMYNCAGDMVQVSASAEGGILAANEFYVTKAYYTNDDYSTNGLDSTGDHMCVENALDLKGGAVGTFPFSEADQLRIIGNYIWGFNRDDDNSCVGGGAGTVGIGVVVHQQAEGIMFKDNVISSDGRSSDSINIESVGIIGANIDTEDSSFINNLYTDLTAVIEMPVAKSANLEYYYETYLNIDRWNHLSNGDTADHLCNVAINVVDDGITAQGSGDLYNYNAYYNSDDTDTTNTNDIVHTSDTSSRNEMYCYPQNILTDLKAVCVPLASTTVESPHGDMCNAPAETATRGVDNNKQLTRVRAGFVAPYLEWTMEYEESPPVTVDGKTTRSFNFVAPVEGFYQFWFRATTTDADDNSLSYSVSGSGGQVLSFAHPATEWRKGKTNQLLKAGLNTVTVVEQEAGIVIDKFIVTNNPTFVSP